MKDLKHKTLRGGVAKVGAQAATLFLRVGSLMVLARLLDPKDFGLVGMVTAFTGVLNLFKDFGLSTAAVQHSDVTEEQSSTLFWINLLVGGVLGCLMVAMAPIVASFYHEPKLFWVTVVLGSSFVVNSAGVQHSVLLQRQMRFTALAIIDVLALLVSIGIGIGMALRGFGYWALVAMTVTPPAVTTLILWSISGWIPGKPHKRAGIRSMMRFGGTVTLNGVVVYIAYNLEKVLLGRYWGAEAVGLYGRAYQLITIPTDSLNSSVGGVAFSALSRVQADPSRLKNYFLKGYSLVLAMTLPITIVCALFAHDLIRVVLGAKWMEAVVIFQLLAPTILIFALINPLAWLMFSLGMVGRSLKVALVLAPLVIAGYVAGLPYGPKGVAFAYSAVMTAWVIPHIAWCVHGTVVSFKDIMVTVSKPLMSGLVAAAGAFALQLLYGSALPPLARLVVGCSALLSIYLLMLFYVMGQKAFYLDLIGSLKPRAASDAKIVVPA